jgi:hypothetical protein
MESSKTLPIPFNIFTDVRYHHVKVVGNEITFQPSTVGLGKLMNKSNILSIEKNKRCWPKQHVNLHLLVI